MGKHGLAVHPYRIRKAGAVTELGDLAIDRDPPGGDPGLDLPARA
jgi:hypothetical protein